MTRLELAAQIASLLNTRPEDYSAKVWHGAKGNVVRVYCRKDTGGQRGWIDAGAIEIKLDGSVEISKTTAFELRVGCREQLAAIALMTAAPEAAPAKPAPVADAAPQGPVDEDVAQFRASETALYLGETA